MGLNWRLALVFKYSIILLAVAYVVLQSIVLFMQSDLVKKTMDLRYTRIPVLLFNGASAVVMIEFIWSSRLRLRKNLDKYNNPPLIVAASVLCVGVVIGSGYELLFSIAFEDCDPNTTVWMKGFEGLVYVVRMLFAPLSLLFVLQRRFFKLPTDDQTERTRAVLINVTLFVTTFRLWLDEGYSVLLYFCAMRTTLDNSSVYCPVIADFDSASLCEESELMKSQKLWYTFHTDFFQRVYLLCSAEFFPVIFILHWLSYGGKLKGLFNFKTHSGALLHEITLSMVKSVSHISQLYDNNVSAATRSPTSNEAVVRTRTNTNTEAGKRNDESFTDKLFRNVVFPAFGMLHAGVMLAYLSSLYFWSVIVSSGTSEDSDSSMALGIGAFGVQLLFFAALTVWTVFLCKENFCDHRMKHMSGDRALLICAAAATLIHLPLDFFELLQLVRTILQIIGLWVQLVVLCRCLALGDQALMSFRFFLPVVALMSAFGNFCAFGCMFMRHGILHQLIHDKKYDMDRDAVLFVLSQSFYPADFLFYFTAALCWTEILVRYIALGIFSVGKMISIAEH